MTFDPHYGGWYRPINPNEHTYTEGFGFSPHPPYMVERKLISRYSSALVLTLVLHVFLEGRLLGFFLLAAGQTGLFCAMYVFLPGRRRGFSESLPGALLGSFGWMVFSALFSGYVEHFSGLANVYGSVYALALGMLWLYGCVSILFYGGVLNRYLAGGM